MDVISKVNGGGAGGKVNDIAARGKDVYAVLEDICLHAVYKFVGILHFLTPIHKLLQPVDALFKLLITRAFFFITPVGSNTIFSILVHLRCADLHLKRFAVIINNGGMQRLVEVILWRSDVIIKFIWNWTPMGMYDAQCGITGGYIWHNEAHTTKIADHLKGFLLLHHLAIDGIDVFTATGDLSGDAGICQHFNEQVNNGLHLAFAFSTGCGQILRDLFVFFGVGIA
ncbi:hypothetical protein SDC9_97037 [bioreactor metagenome]|uniref:Uncharacterized protein n=1 Tax=bioreactor metagenome TaxID=1076179 RepID=A0A645AC71_9ZZZZ